MKQGMRRLLAALCCMCMMAVCLTGCGKSTKMADSQFLGTWKAATCEYDGFEMETESVIDEFSVTLQEDGQYTAAIQGASETGKWEELEEGNGVKLDGDDELIFKATEDGRLSLDYSEIIIYFER